MSCMIPRRNFVCHLALAVALAVVGGASAAPPVRLRVLTYNIHHGEGTDGRLSLERIARVIRSADPDVVALQEVDRKTERTGGVDQAARLADLCRMHMVFGKNLDYQGGAYGNAVLSKAPIARSRNYHLPRHDDGEQRGVLTSHIDVPGMPEPLLFFCTHLDHRSPDGERFASVLQINQLLQELTVGREQRAALLAGDLNDVPTSRVLGRLKQVWTPVAKEPMPTVPVDRPQRQIDYILFRPAGRWRVVEALVIDQLTASDHRPVLAVLEWTEPP